MKNINELKKEVLVLSFILILVIIIATALNINSKKKRNQENKMKTHNQLLIEESQESHNKLLNNLKGLLDVEENTTSNIQKELEGKNETIITTNSGEQIIIME